MFVYDLCVFDSVGGLEGSLYSSDSEIEDPNNANTQSPKVNIAIDNWIKFRLEPHNAELITHLRQKWHALVLRRLSHPTKPLTQTDEVNRYPVAYLPHYIIELLYHAVQFESCLPLFKIKYM